MQFFPPKVTSMSDLSTSSDRLEDSVLDEADLASWLQKELLFETLLINTCFAKKKKIKLNK